MKIDVIKKLKEHGLKVTPQRVTILNAINEYGHANIDEIYQKAKATHYSMSLATVYKNVTSLVELNLLKELSLNSFKSKYEIVKEPHSHLVCKKCGSVEDIELSQEIEQNAAALASIKDFEAQDIEVEIYGLCRECREQGRV